MGAAANCQASPNWQGRARQFNVDVWAYTNAHEVELFVNNVSFGRQTVPHLEKAGWSVPYKPGALEAVGYSANGKVLSRKLVKTTGQPAGLRLSVEKGHSTLRADGADAGLVAVAVVDAQGLVVPTASNLITFTIEGVGQILGVGNGDPSCHEPDKANRRSAFNGLARVVVGQSIVAGKLKLTATSPGLAAATVEISVGDSHESIPEIVI